MAKVAQPWVLLLILVLNGSTCQQRRPCLTASFEEARWDYLSLIPVGTAVR
jgi:hypothetical protein